MKHKKEIDPIEELRKGFILLFFMLQGRVFRRRGFETCGLVGCFDFLNLLRIRTVFKHDARQEIR